MPSASNPIVIVGAGAAGLVAAIFAAERGPVFVIETTRDGGRKVLISGGGRCNILPNELQPHRFVTDSSPHLLRRMLKAWPLMQQRAFFERDIGIPLALEPETGKLFPVSNQARDVRDGLGDYARRRGVQFQFDTSLIGLVHGTDGWRVTTSRGEFVAAAVVLATGGLSVPTTGSDGSGLRLAEQLGHSVNSTYPALTPLVSQATAHGTLAGISLPVRMRGKWLGRATESNGGFLFTHRGYSGPSVLDISHLAVRSRLDGDPPAQRAVLRVSWSERTAPEWAEALSRSPGLVMSVVARQLPPRLAERLLQEAGVPRDRKTAELRRTERAALLEALTAFVLPWSGDEGYRKAEVTGGGVALDEVHTGTLESRRHPGLFLCGEMLDAFGPIGGHNFAWAWSTGRSAGLGAAGHARRVHTGE